ISQTPGDYTAIVYNAAMQAERMNFFADSSEEISYRFTRDNTGRITVIELYDESEKVIYVTFDYKADNTLNKAQVYAFDNGVPLEANRLEFEYNSLKQISRMNQIDPKTGKLQGYDILTFDAKGNAIKSESHYINESGDDETMAINEYEYDDKKNPQLAIGFPLYLDNVYDISQNNVTKEIEKDAQGRINRTVTHTYEYTAEGYPKSSTYTTSGSNVKSTYDYTCK
ncbi:MAG: hypothetical protein ACXWW0_05705, partial [Bacteroidia bacterium]